MVAVVGAVGVATEQGQSSRPNATIDHTPSSTSPTGAVSVTTALRPPRLLRPLDLDVVAAGGAGFAVELTGVSSLGRVDAGLSDAVDADRVLFFDDGLDWKSIAIQGSIS